MSILIQGMEMPKNCRICPCFQYDMFDDDIDGYCKALKTKIMNRSKHHPDCPLIELPPHGRLIDADKFEFEMNDKLLVALTEKYGEEEAQKGLHFSFRDCISNIQFQPTVIEGSET